jgi:hypothetical protein
MPTTSLLEILDDDIDDTSEAGHVDRNGTHFGAHSSFGLSKPVPAEMTINSTSFISSMSCRNQIAAASGLARSSSRM